MLSYDLTTFVLDIEILKTKHALQLFLAIGDLYFNRMIIRKVL